MNSIQKTLAFCGAAGVIRATFWTLVFEASGEALAEAKFVSVGIFGGKM